MMSARCPGVMELTDDKPCHYKGSGALPTSPIVGYVSPMMRGSLWKWLDGKDPAQGGRPPSPQKRATCATRVHSQLKAALTCFHEAGFIHFDIKGDNVYYG